MIKYFQYSEKYKKKVKEFIYQTMLKELQINNSTLNNLTKDLDDIQKSYMKNGGNFWIAIDTVTDDVVGTVSVKKLGKSDAEFKRYYVKEEYRNQGIGCTLYKMAEEFAINTKVKNLYLTSGKSLTKAHKIYDENGWIKISEKHNVHNIFIREGAYLFKKNLLKTTKNKDIYQDANYDNNYEYNYYKYMKLGKVL